MRYIIIALMFLSFSSYGEEIAYNSVIPLDKNIDDLCNHYNSIKKRNEYLIFELEKIENKLESCLSSNCLDSEKIKEKINFLENEKPYINEYLFSLGEHNVGILSGDIGLELRLSVDNKIVFYNGRYVNFNEKFFYEKIKSDFPISIGDKFSRNFGKIDAPLHKTENLRLLIFLDKNSFRYSIVGSINEICNRLLKNNGVLFELVQQSTSRDFTVLHTIASNAYERRQGDLLITPLLRSIFDDFFSRNTPNRNDILNFSLEKYKEPNEDHWVYHYVGEISIKEQIEKFQKSIGKLRSNLFNSIEAKNWPTTDEIIKSSNFLWNYYDHISGCKKYKLFVGPQKKTRAKLLFNPIHKEKIPSEVRGVFEVEINWNAKKIGKMVFGIIHRSKAVLLRVIVEDETLYGYDCLKK